MPPTLYLSGGREADADCAASAWKLTRRLIPDSRRYITKRLIGKRVTTSFKKGKVINFLYLDIIIICWYSHLPPQVICMQIRTQAATLGLHKRWHRRWHGGNTGRGSGATPETALGQHRVRITGKITSSDIFYKIFHIFCVENLQVPIFFVPLQSHSETMRKFL